MSDLFNEVDRQLNRSTMRTPLLFKVAAGFIFIVFLAILVWFIFVGTMVAKVAGDPDGVARRAGEIDRSFDEGYEGQD